MMRDTLSIKGLSIVAAAALLTACGSEAPDALPENQLGENERWREAENRSAEVSNLAKGPLSTACGAPLDTNANGIVEQAEYLSFGNFSFPDWDDDDDGTVRMTEFGSCWGAMGWGEGEAAFAAFDQDGNGNLTREEFFRRDIFSRWDRDGDERLGPSEWPPN